MVKITLWGNTRGWGMVASAGLMVGPGAEHSPIGAVHVGT